MSLDLRAEIIFSAWNMLNQSDDPMMATQESVMRVWKNCGYKLAINEQDGDGGLEGLIATRIT